MTSQPPIPLRHSGSSHAVTIGARSFTPPDSSGHLPPPSRGSEMNTRCLELAGGLRDPRSFIPVILSSYLKVTNYSADDVAKPCESKDVIRVHP